MGYGIKLVWEDDQRREGMKRRGTRSGSASHLNFDQTTHGKYAEICEDMTANAPVDEDQPGCDTFHALDTDITVGSDADLNDANIPTTGNADTMCQSLMRLANTQPAAFNRTMSLFPQTLTENQALLFDHYVQRFSKTYPTCCGPDNPFISVFLPLAMNNETVLTSLLALSGAQSWRGESGGLEEEVLMLRRRALSSFREQLQRLINLGSQRSIESQNNFPSTIPTNATAFSFLDDDDRLFLSSTAMILLLYEKLSGEDESNWKPHLEFICQIFGFHPLTFLGKPAIQSSTTTGLVPLSSRSAHVTDALRFLYNLFLYNDLVSSTSLRRPTLSDFYVQATGNEAKVQTSSFAGMYNGAYADDDDANRYYFPSLIARMSAGDLSVSAFDIAMWDGRLDWLPSFSLVGSYSGNDPADFGNKTSSDQITIAAIYRSTAAAYRLQTLQTLQGCKTHEDDDSPPLTRHLTRVLSDYDVTDELRNECNSAISLMKLLPMTSSFENALLWPIGIVAKDLTIQDAMERNYILQRLEHLEQRFRMKHFRKAKEILQRHWMDIDYPSGATYATGFILQG